MPKTPRTPNRVAELIEQGFDFFAPGKLKVAEEFAAVYARSWDFQVELVSEVTHGFVTHWVAVKRVTPTVKQVLKDRK